MASMNRFVENFISAKSWFALSMIALQACGEDHPVRLDKTPTLEEFAAAAPCDESCAEGGDCNFAGAITPYRAADIRHISCRIDQGNETATCSFKLVPRRNLGNVTSRPNPEFVGTATLALSNNRKWCVNGGMFWDRARGNAYGGHVYEGP
jgi:hypothetical protein